MTPEINVSPLPSSSDVIAVWFSCGAASAVAAKLTVLKYGDHCDVRIINSPIMEEDIDNRRFYRDVEAWVGKPFEMATNPKYPLFSAVMVWEQRQFMAGNTGAPCTFELKKKSRQIWESQHNPHWHVLGFTVDEKARHDRFVLSERTNVLPILIEAGMTKQDCANMVMSAGILLPASYAQGYPNANCIGCVKATSPTYWNHVRKAHPHVFEQRAIQSRRIGARLVRYKNKRIFLDELPPDAKGRPMESMTVECGIFCEEPT